VPVFVFLSWFVKSKSFREFLLALNPRILTLVQAWRIGGFVFLVLYTYCILPGIFALPAGWGDIAIGATAPLVALRLANPDHRKSFVLWQALGMFDLVTAIAVGTTARLINPFGVATTAMTVLPLSLIPTFAVLLLLILHIILHCSSSQMGGATTFPGWGGIAVIPGINGAAWRLVLASVQLVWSDRMVRNGDKRDDGLRWPNDSYSPRRHWCSKPKPDREAWVRGCVQICDDVRPVKGDDLDWEFALVRAFIRPATAGRTQWLTDVREDVMIYRLHPDAAGIDIEASELFVAVAANRDPQPVRSFPTFTRDLRALARLAAALRDSIRCHGIYERVLDSCVSDS